MKNTFAILFAAIHLILNMNIGVSVHFCGGDLSALSWTKGGAAACLCSKPDAQPDEDMGCCKDKTTVIKSTENAIANSKQSVDFPISWAVCSVLIFCHNPTFFSSLLSIQYTDSKHNDLLQPPKIPLWLRFRVFRI